MHLPVPHPQPQPALDPPAMVRTATREDVLWNRPVFKAPPLELHLPAFDAKSLAEEVRRIGLIHR